MRSALILISAAIFAGCADAPCMVDPAVLDFGEVDATSLLPASRFIKVTNPSSRDRVCIPQPLTAPFSAETSGVLIPAFSDRLINVLFAPSDGLLHHDTLRLSSSDGSCELEVQLTGLGTGTLQVNPPAPLFIANPGETVTQELRFVNTRRTPVSFSTQWIFLPGGPMPFEFQTATSEVPASSAITTIVKATATSWNSTTAVLRVTTDNQEFQIPMLLQPSSPRLEVSPRLITVPRAAVGDFFERSFRISNGGSSGRAGVFPLEIARVGITEGDPRDVDILQLSRNVLTEGESTELTVRVELLSAGPRIFRFRVTPRPEFLNELELVLTTTAETLPPCGLQVEPRDQLTMRDVEDGGVEGRVTFTNTGSGLCLVDNLRLSSSAASLYTFNAPSQMEVPPGSSREVTISGPRPRTGSTGQFGFHVLRDGRSQEWIELSVP